MNKVGAFKTCKIIFYWFHCGRSVILKILGIHWVFRARDQSIMLAKLLEQKRSKAAKQNASIIGENLTNSSKIEQNSSVLAF